MGLVMWCLLRVSGFERGEAVLWAGSLASR